MTSTSRSDRARRRPAAVLWDMDGTLVDTEPYWIECEFELVEAHGGTIGARNSPVGGAIFTLTLPATDAHEIRSSKLEYLTSSSESSNA